MPGSMPFSPLFIGEVSGTCVRSRIEPRTSSFQSPLHRGSLWNNYSRTLHRSGRIFFQYPLHQGSLWNAHEIDAELKTYELSVPSSSGKSLERMGQGIRRLLRFLLSVPSSSGKSLELQITVSGRNALFTFQSPLHRGSLWNARPLGLLDEWVSVVTPLF